MPKEQSLRANVERFAENREAREFYDVVGIGFGPSNLAVAATIQEESEAGAMPPVRSLFLESKPRYAWHPDMLLQGAQVQLTFLKDLVTLRNPQSRFTFLSYLRDKGRLNKFVNLRNFYPTRIEFNDYYCWVAQQLADQVRYSRRVLTVSPLAMGDSPQIELLKVQAENTVTGAREEYLCRNLIVATGGVPRLPRELDVPVDERIFHSHQFLSRIESRYPDHNAPHRFVVVGSGQSSAEIFHYLMSSYPNAQVTAALRRFAYKPADDSDFVNEIFFPHMVSFLYGLPEARRRAILREHNDTNYSAVDLDLIKLIYQALYERMIVGDDRLAIRSFLEIRGLRTTGGAVIAEFFNSANEGLELIEADGVILATGYEREKRHPLLVELDPYLVSNATGYCVQRDYRLLTEPAFAPGIFFQGFCEDTHGLSDTLLSVLPARSYEIFQALLGNQIEQIEQIETELSQVSAKGAP